MDIIESIIKKFASSFYSEYQWCCDELNNKVNEVIKLNSEIKEQDRLLKSISKILEKQDDVLNIINNDIVVFKESGQDIVVTNNINPYNNNYKCKIVCSWNRESKYISIKDISSSIIDKEFGSIAMKELFRDAKKLGIETITGVLCFKNPLEEDYLEHKGRLLKFYQNHGFEITDGKIKKNLND